MTLKRTILILILSVISASCAGKTADNAAKQEAQRQERAKATQAQMDIAMQELDTGKPVSSIPDSAKTGRDDRYNTSISEANKAQQELLCAVDKDCVAEEIPAQTPSVESPSAVAEKPRPGAVTEPAAAPRKATKYPIIDGYPAWFHTPDYDGYLGGVGIAKPQRAGYSAQKRIAVSLAQADLTRNIKVNVYNELISERVSINSTTAKHYQEKIETMSRQDADQYLNNPTVMDEWVDEKTGELYVWVVLPK